jgi:hypothetical protein
MTFRIILRSIDFTVFTLLEGPPLLGLRLHLLHLHPHQIQFPHYHWLLLLNQRVSSLLFILWHLKDFLLFSLFAKLEVKSAFDFSVVQVSELIEEELLLVPHPHHRRVLLHCPKYRHLIVKLHRRCLRSLDHHRRFPFFKFN